MYRYLLAGTALATLAVPLAAQTLVEDRRTQPIRTSGLKGGAGDAVKVTDKGSIELTAGSAITVDSDHDTVNDGKIAVTNANGASGIEVVGDRQADIVNSGTITIDETYIPEDFDNDEDLDGPFAVGRDRAAIRVRGNLVGDIRHTGTIAVEGDDSAGISVAGLLDGDLVHDGKTSVVGDNSVGVEVGDVTGNVRLAGSITAVGEGSSAAHLGGDIDGALVIQGNIAATGYRYTTPPADPSKLDEDDLLQGGSALIIEGDVAKGVYFAIAPKDADKDNPDEDKDGIEDAKEGSAKVVSYGAAPAVVIGAEDRDIAIGAVPATGSGFGLIIDGSIAGHGVYEGVDGNGMAIGGRGGAVTIEKGISVAGSIEATSKDANATALRLGAGASTGELRVSGGISAVTGKDADSRATAIAIDQGASLPYLRNSGTIKAAAGGEDGAAIAIVDQSGTLRLVENSGKIIATGAKAGSGRNIAIDLSSVTSGATVKQTAVGSGVDAPVIEGDIRFGTGNDVLELADGKATSHVTFGSGQDRLIISRDAIFSGRVDFGGQADELAMSGTSSFSGEADFGGGAASVTFADKASFTGRFIDSQNVAVALEGGTLDLASPTTIASLEVGAKGVIVATLSKKEDEGSALTVSGDASFEKGAKLKLRVTDIADAEGTYTVIRAGSLTGADDLASDTTLVPFMYEAALAIDETAGLVNVDIERKAAKDLGLNAAQTAAYDSLYTALADDEDIAGVFLGITDGALFQATVGQALPDHAGGAFEGLSQGMRTFARRLADGDGPIEATGKLRFTFEGAGWGSSKDQQDSASYDLDGLGFSAGAELLTGIGRVGASATWLWNRYDSGSENSVLSNTYEAALYWRGDWGAFSSFARGSYGFSDFEGSRRFIGMNGDETIDRLIERDWSGNVASFIAGASVEGGSQYFFIRPSVIVDYIRLSEDGYEETGGGEALDLAIEDRSSDELGLNLATALGFDLFGMSRGDDIWMRLEAEGGWREILAGELGGTTARFGDDESFTLLPDQRSSGWFARLRGQGGDEFYTVSGELSVEEHNDKVGYALRASLNLTL
ncbi:autotransporter outer membrane beta-barrel domain-containing protein [Qipengyuania qiaonensis]|uniref:Autotransporter domain-containing protein n=1 Tax=Qipengyuania qiaonensis TaxID=2867240 RepID=A0ABS7J3N5_9SPHN|nr:autotransporter outer membrane beta-barrel domain-containing protein [Qipengyuania qiaonensis]MBX7481942.1 autotransporter domain-containing protein [Qipengyuania qiaonensis]